MSMVPWHPDSYFTCSSWLTFLPLLILLHLKSMHCRNWLLPGLVPSGCHDNTPSEQALDAGLLQYNSGQERVQVTLRSPAGDEGRRSQPTQEQLLSPRPPLAVQGELETAHWSLCFLMPRSMWGKQLGTPQWPDHLYWEERNSWNPAPKTT